MNENNTQNKKIENKQTNKVQELNKMKEVLSVEAAQNSEIIKENKETKNKN